MKNKILIILIAASFFSFGQTFLLQAQTLTEYHLLAPIPVGNNNTVVETTNAQTFIPGLVRLVIMLATGLATLFIIYGGIQYMSTDSFSGTEDAKNTIENALWGLFLVMSAWLILNTINPNLVKFDLSIERQETPQNFNLPVGGGGRALTEAEINDDAAIRTSLPAGITASGPCTQGETSNCVNLNGIQPQVISGLSSLKTACNCDIRITGGTEGGHSSHSGGNVVDIGASSDINKAVAGTAQLEDCKIYSAPSGGSFLWESKGSKCGGSFASTADHWHATF